MNIVIDNMLEKLGDGNRALVRQSDDTLLEATNHPLIGYDMVIERIVWEQTIQLQMEQQVVAGQRISFNKVNKNIGTK